MSLPNIPAHLAGLVGQALEQDDQATTATYTGSEPPAAGTGFAYLTQYIELGLQPPRPNSQYPKNKDKVRLTFALTGPKWPEKEIEVTLPDGVTKAKKTVNELLSVTLTLSNSDKADFHNLLLTMKRAHAAAQEVGHMAGFLGIPFVTEVVHNVVGTGADKKTYANINVGKTWNFRPMTFQDPVTGEMKAYQAPALAKDTEFKVFFFHRPTKETWDSLFIPGVKEEGKGTKNWLQELIMNAVNYQGSQLHAMLGGVMPVTGTDAASALAAAQASLAAQAVPANAAGAGTLTATETVQPAPVIAPADTVSAPVVVPSALPAPVVEQPKAYELTEKAKAATNATLEQWLASPDWTVEKMVAAGYAQELKPAAVELPGIPAIPGGLPLPGGLPVVGA